MTVSDRTIETGQVPRRSANFVVACRQGHRLAATSAHPDLLVLPALAADTPVHISRVGAVLQVAPTSRV